MGKSILTSEQSQILDCVLDSSEIITKFYLTGGTALSEYYFQHRLSEDFDFFTEQTLVEEKILHWVKKTSQKLHIEEVEYKTLNGQMIFFFHFPHTVVKLDFAQYPFPHLGEFKKYKSLRIASLLDIGVNKIQAIQTRKRGRDFFDLYCIVAQMKLSFEELLKAYRTKFEVTLSSQELAKHLMGVLEASDQPRFLGKVDWSKVEKFFISAAGDMSKSFLKK